jgi:dienelactone hydrolase
LAVAVPIENAGELRVTDSMKTAILLLLALPTAAAVADPLPNTAALDWPEEDLSERLMDGAHEFVERKINEAQIQAREREDAPDREAFKRMIGVVDERVGPARLERFGDDENPALVAEFGDSGVFQVRWPTLDGVWGEGLLVEPVKNSKGLIIVIPDADQIPEQLLGLAEGGEGHCEFTRRLVQDGYTLVIPALINREIYLGESGDDPRLKRADQSHREWIYRQAFHMGRHVIGYEVQRMLALVDWAENRHEKVFVSGYGEGGMLALFAAAADERIDAALVRGYPGTRTEAWKQPIDRNLFGRLPEFSDARIAALVEPRPLLTHGISGPGFETSKGSLIQDEGNLDHGILAARGNKLLVGENSGAKAIAGADVGFRLVTRFFADPVKSVDEPLSMTNGISADVSIELIPDRRQTFDSADRHQRLFSQLEGHVQGLVRASNQVREQFFLHAAEPLFEGGKWSTEKGHPTLDPAGFIEKSKEFRRRFDEEAMGRFDEQLLAPNPRSRKILETEKWTAWDVVLDVYPEFVAWGVLILPKDLKPGERRPVVVCQHGRQGLPRDTIDAEKTAYNDYAAKLAERGFITFAPHNLYRGEDRYRWLDRKANMVGCSLFSFIIPSHEQILTWLKTLPNVDPERIAFYGLSYGGETAVRVPPVVEDYAVVICSGDFNQWTRKVAATDFPGSFMQSIEWEMPYWNLGHTFDYAEMAALIFPRPFMVERGHHDRVSRDHWVAHEYAKVRWLYAQFGLADRTEIEYFQGGHSINGQGTFDFLHRHLSWPKP